MTTYNAEFFDGEELLALARADIEKGLHDSALYKLKTAMQKQNLPVEVFAVIGRLYAQLRLWEKAKENLSKFLETNPKAITEKFQFGMVLFDSGDKVAALSVWKELLTLAPLHPPAMFYSALINADMGAVDAAKTMLDKLLQNAPVDNLYFERAKELLQAISKAGVAGSKEKKIGTESDESVDSNVFKVNPETAYKTEH